VTSQEALALLATLGCNQAQGYYIKQPVPAEELLAYLQANPALVSQTLKTLSFPGQ